MSVQLKQRLIDSGALLEDVLAFLKDREILLVLKFDKEEQRKKMLLEPWNQVDIE
jgi:hypothetical protein